MCVCVCVYVGGGVCVCVCVCVCVQLCGVRGVHSSEIVMYTIPASFCLLLSRTRMDSNPELEFCRWHVSYREGEDGGEEMKRHGGYLTGMLVTIADRKTRHHHVLCGGGGEGGGEEGRRGGGKEGRS